MSLPFIQYENNDFTIVFKPAKIQIHPDDFNKEGTLVDFLLSNYPSLKNVGEDLKRPGIVHRLDRDTEGLVIIPKTQTSFLYFKNCFKTRKIKKIYWALVFGILKKDDGKIDLPIGRSLKKTSIRTTSAYSKDKKEALTYYRVLKRYWTEKRFKNREIAYSLLEVLPKTGRTHQIRVHLKALGYPICGDPVYKIKRQIVPKKLMRMFLVAYSLEFFGPDGKKYFFQKEPEKDLLEVLEDLCYSSEGENSKKERVKCQD